jgi:hypothetical protein
MILSSIQQGRFGRFIQQLALWQQLLQRPGNDLFEPGQQVAKSGLSGFQTHHTRYDGAIHLAADAVYEFVLHLVKRRNQHVTSGSAHYFDEGISFSFAAYRSGMGIKGAYAHHYALV